MRQIVGVGALAAPAGGAAVTIGTFDGVHIGHRALITRTVQRAAALGAVPVAITWDRHPSETLRPDQTPPLLTGQERKVELLSETELEMLVVLPFDKEFSQWPPERFAVEVLAHGLGARAVIVGNDWRFGHRASGDVSLLTEIGRDSGFEVEGLTLAEIEGEPVSSSRVRRALEAGDTETARALLGRPFDLDGVVVRGDDRGRDLGYPTANLDIERSLARPAPGIYAGRGRVGGGWHRAAISVGYNPTFGGDPGSSPLRTEAYLLDFDDDVYGQTIRLEFWKRLRDEVKFDSVDDLVAQMGRDVEQTRLVEM